MIWAWLNKQAGWFLTAGLGLIVWRNLRHWRQDRLAALRTRKREPEPVEFGATPKVSVLVAAWNESDTIAEHIRSFLDLRYPNKELVLCAGGKDGTYEIACRYAGEQVIVLRQEAGEGKQQALRRGFPSTSGEILYLTDADCILDDQALELTIAPLINGDEQVATGSHRPLNAQLGRAFVIYQWYYHIYRKALWPLYVDGLQGANTALRRQVIEQLGGFHDEVPVGTDYYLARQLAKGGYRIRYVAHSEIQTPIAATYRQYWRQQSRWQRNTLLHGVRYGAWVPVLMTIRRGVMSLLVLGGPVLAALARSPLLFSV